MHMPPGLRIYENRELKAELWDAAKTLRGSAVDRTDWKATFCPCCSSSVSLTSGTRRPLRLGRTEIALSSVSFRGRKLPKSGGDSGDQVNRLALLGCPLSMARCMCRAAPQSGRFPPFPPIYTTPSRAAAPSAQTHTGQKRTASRGSPAACPSPLPRTPARPSP